MIGARVRWFSTLGTQFGRVTGWEPAGDDTGGITVTVLPEDSAVEVVLSTFFVLSSEGGAVYGPPRHHT